MDNGVVHPNKTPHKTLRKFNAWRIPAGFASPKANSGMEAYYAAKVQKSGFSVFFTVHDCFSDFL